MRLSDFDYKLPPGRVAQYPSQKRAHSRMLVLNRAEKTITDAHFYEFPQFLNSSYFLVLNDSKVFKARLFARRTTGGKVEVFLVRRSDRDHWLCLLRPSGRIKAGEKLYFDSRNFITVLDGPGPVERQISFPGQTSQNQTREHYRDISKIEIASAGQRDPDKQGEKGNNDG